MQARLQFSRHNQIGAAGEALPDTKIVVVGNVSLAFVTISFGAILLTLVIRGNIPISVFMLPFPQRSFDPKEILYAVLKKTILDWSRSGHQRCWHPSPTIL